MTIEDHEFTAYVLGDAPDDLVMRVERQAAGDEGLAAELAAFAPFRVPPPAGSPPALATQPSTRRGRRRAVARSAVLAAGIVLAVTGATWGGYELLRSRPLFEDDFNSGTIEYSRWDPHLGRKGVSAHNAYLQLLNRGSVVTRQEFDGPIEITFDWRWVDHGQWPLYAEEFCVCLHTTGRHQDEHDFRVLDGFLIEFNAVENTVLARTPDGTWVQGSGPDSTPLVPEQWHHVRIVDDGKEVSVFLAGPSINPKYKREPVLTASVTPGLRGKHIAFFNREYVGKTNHESHADNVQVSELRK
jgi:hypothetical protein